MLTNVNQGTKTNICQSTGMKYVVANYQNWEEPPNYLRTHGLGGTKSIYIISQRGLLNAKLPSPLPFLKTPTFPIYPTIWHLLLNQLEPSSQNMDWIYIWEYEFKNFQRKDTWHSVYIGNPHNSVYNLRFSHRCII